MKQFQSFHIVRLFGIVSKCSPSSAVAAAAARTFRSGVGGGSSSGSGGVVSGSGAVNVPQTKFRFNLRRILSCRTFWRRRQPNRQAEPVPIKKKPLNLSAEDAAVSNTSYGNSPTPNPPATSNETSNNQSKM